MNKIYHLSTCSTCARILKRFNLSHFELQDIKNEPITEEQLDLLYSRSGSYEALFSRRAMKYRALGLHNQQLTERDYRKHILNEYTFLKRPVILIGESIFVGNTAKTIDAAVAHFEAHTL